MRKNIILLVLFTLASSALSQDINDYLLRSSARLEAGDVNGALGICREALSRGEDYRLYLVLGDTQYRMGLRDEALSSYSRANSIAPGSGEFGMALIFADRKEADKSVYHLEKHLRSGYKKTEKELLLNNEFAGIHLSNEWKSLWKGSWYTELEKGISEAVYLEANDRVEELEMLENKLLPLYGEEAGMSYLRAIVKMAGKNTDEALTYFREAEEKGYSTRAFYDKYIDLLLENKKYFDAVGVAETAIQIYPGKSDYHLHLAEASRGSGDRDRALREAKLYLDLFPDNEEGLALAGIIMNELSNYSDALKYFSRSVQLYPGNPDHYINRGDVYSRTKTWQYAVSDYSMALDLQPGDGDVYYRKGKALLSLGKRDDACRDFRMALKYGNKKAAAEINKNCIR